MSISKWLFIFTVCFINLIPPAQAGETITYYHIDALGNPVAATDENGDLLWRQHYSPYGEEQIDNSSTTEQRTSFTGKEQDRDTGLVYFGARDYHPVLGRFMSIDPVGFRESNIQSFNRYAYANNNPYKFVDSDGRYADLALESFSIGFGIGSFFSNLSQGNYGSAAVDAGGVFVDGTLALIPGVPGVAGLGINASREAAEQAAKKSDDFFEGTKYTDKVKGQMKQGDFHSFPESVTGFQDAGKITEITGGDGVVRDKLEIPGNYRGHDGNFEFIKEPNNTINHRVFRPNKD